MNHLLKILVVIVLTIHMGCKAKPKEESKMNEPKQASTQEQTIQKNEPFEVTKISKIEAPANQMPKSDSVAIIDVENYGRIVIGFFPNKAPEHVKNFIKLAKEGFYNGCTFHRIIPGFMIQGGDPNSKDDDPTNDGMGGPPHRLKAEFNDLKHLPGTLSMARTMDPNSAGSQFFIMHKAAPHLDKQYSIFGQVLSGMDVVDKIANAPRGSNDNPFAMDSPKRQKIIMKVHIVPWSEVVPE
ncbi:MAG: peptidylprolyl isomerase [bacterium]|nr:peptidylprolyl isomerase [bacterium]